MWEFIVTCFKVCIIILLFPVIIGVLVWLGLYIIPVFFLAIPIMIIAWFWLLFS